MPANLPPQYHAAEARYRAASTPEEKIQALREMLAVMPKHKGTEKMQADIRRRISQLQAESKRARATARGAPPWIVEKVGIGQVPVVGPPNAGKSSLVAALTRAEPRIADYPFTTTAPCPGMMEFENVQVQLVDTPPLGPGHWVDWMPDLLRRADACLLLLDLAVPEPWAAVAPIRAGFRERGVWLGPPGPDDEPGPFDVVVPVLVVANKADAPGAAERWAAWPANADRPALAVSARRGDGLDALRRRVFETLNVVRVYPKPPGKPPDRSEPFVLPAGSTVRALAERIHKEVARGFRYARVWGGSGKFEGQRVGEDHVLADGDVVEIHAG